jgi:hypothetical protein
MKSVKKPIIKKSKILKRNPVAKAMGELGYAPKVVPSKKTYKRIKKKILPEEQHGKS